VGAGRIYIEFGGAFADSSDALIIDGLELFQGFHLNLSQIGDTNTVILILSDIQFFPIVGGGGGCDGGSGEEQIVDLFIVNLQKGKLYSDYEKESVPDFIKVTHNKYPLSALRRL
jgi:hypothetical protein